MRVIRQLNSALMDRIQRLADSSVEVGFFPESTYDDGTPVAAVAYKNEYGSKGEGVPMRPFMRQTIHEKENEWIRTTVELFQKSTDDDKAMQIVGNVMAGDIKEKIYNWTTPSPHNSPATIKRKGFDKPLVDTHTMANSVKAKVVTE